jgi:hypothetical protein
MASVGVLSSLLAALPMESYFVLPPSFAPAAVRVDDGAFLLACVPPLLNKDGNTVHYAVQRYRYSPLIATIEKEDRATEKEITLAIGEAIIESDGAPPCIDALLYAYLLSLPGVNYVLQGLSVAVNQILCSPRGREFAKHRILPEETIACGLNSLFVPYADSGLPLAQAVKFNFEAHKSSAASLVKILLLQNRGFMALGGSSLEVLRSYYTLEKTAQVWFGAALLGGPTFLTAPSVMRLTQIAESINPQRTLELSIASTTHRELDNKQTLNFSDKADKESGALFREKSENKKDANDDSRREDSLVVRQDVPLFDEDSGSDYKSKLSFSRRTPNAPNVEN